MKMEVPPINSGDGMAEKLGERLGQFIEEDSTEAREKSQPLVKEGGAEKDRAIKAVEGKLEGSYAEKIGAGTSVEKNSKNVSELDYISASLELRKDEDPNKVIEDALVRGVGLMANSEKDQDISEKRNKNRPLWKKLLFVGKVSPDDLDKVETLDAKRFSAAIKGGDSIVAAKIYGEAIKNGDDRLAELYHGFLKNKAEIMNKDPKISSSEVGKIRDVYERATSGDYR
ncbi:MAG: hypothetical protein HZA25_03210 [Candidatus Niyogibacteria bacterium]|nr:hypothetical protein [Candidatus Niyogibacteria bacterium]